MRCKAAPQPKETHSGVGLKRGVRPQKLPPSITVFFSASSNIFAKSTSFGGSFGSLSIISFAQLWSSTEDFL